MCSRGIIFFLSSQVPTAFHLFPFRFLFSYLTLLPSEKANHINEKMEQAKLIDNPSTSSGKKILVKEG